MVMRQETLIRIVVQRVIEALKQALDSVLPSTIRLSQVDLQLAIATELGTDFISLGENIEGNMGGDLTDEQAIKVASLNMMNELQDVVTIALRSPWPPQEEAGAPSGEFAEPHAEIRDHTLHLWFGSESEHCRIP